MRLSALRLASTALAAVITLPAVAGDAVNVNNNAFGPFAFLAPQISVVSTGNALDVTPIVSADRKYITFNGIHAQNAAFLGSIVENVPFFAPLGVVRQFQAQPRRVLFGAWTGSVREDGGKPQAVSVDLAPTEPVVRIAGHPGEVQADRFQTATGAAQLRLAYRLVGKPRRGPGGRPVETFDDHFFNLDGTLSADGHRLTGACTHNGKPGTFTLTRAAPAIPSDLIGSWRASAANARSTWKGDERAVLTVRRDGERWLAELPLAHAISLSPLFWQDDSRGVVFQVVYQDTPTSAPQRGFLNGRFSPDGSLLRARLTVGTLIDGQMDLVRPAP